MMIKIPGLTDTGMVSNKLVELVDLFPTLVEAAELSGLNQCSSATSYSELTCHEGSSLMPLIRQGDSATWKQAAFSQLKNGGNRMGYSIRTSRYRYTETVLWDSVDGPNFNRVRARELYDYYVDPYGDYNVADTAKYVNNGVQGDLHDQWWPAGFQPFPAQQGGNTRKHLTEFDRSS